jgi:hypothetical protein
VAVDSSITAVFRSESVVEAPFVASLSDRAILFPVLSPVLPREVVEALAQHLEPNCWLCFVGLAPQERLEEFATRRLDLRDGNEYAQLARFPFPHALAAVDGSWGAILSEESFALLAAKPEAMSELKAEAPWLDFERQRVGFEIEFANDAQWPRRVLEHVYPQ